MDCFGGKEDLKSNFKVCWRARKAVPGGCYTDSPVPALSSALEFAIEEGYKAGFAEASGAVEKIAPERLQAEFFQADPGRVGGQVLTEYLPVFQVFCRRRASAECLELAAGGKSSGWPASFRLYSR